MRLSPREDAHSFHASVFLPYRKKVESVLLLLECKWMTEGNELIKQACSELGLATPPPPSQQETLRRLRELEGLREMERRGAATGAATGGLGGLSMAC